MTTEPDAYAVLQVDPGAEDYVVSAAYRAAARRCHPDGIVPDAARMTSLNGAYDRVKTPEARRAYDAERSRLVAVGPGPAAPIYDAWPDTRYAPDPHSEAQILGFGRYAGWKSSDVAREDPDHLHWLSRNATERRIREAIERHLSDDREVERRADTAR